MYDSFKIIDDAEILEGIVGGIGTLCTFILFRHILNFKKKSGIILGLSFLTTWILRKIVMNIYNNIKKIYKINNKIYNIKTNTTYINT